MSALKVQPISYWKSLMTESRNFKIFLTLWWQKQILLLQVNYDIFPLSIVKYSNFKALDKAWAFTFENLTIASGEFFFFEALDKASALKYENWTIASREIS